MTRINGPPRHVLVPPRRGDRVEIPCDDDGDFIGGVGGGGVFTLLFGPFEGEVFEFFHEHCGLHEFDVGEGGVPFCVGVCDEDAVVVLFVAEETGYGYVVSVHDSVEYVFGFLKVFSF